MNLEVGPNLLSALLAALALVGTIVTGILAYLNGQKMKQVEKNTNGITERLVQAAYREGKLEGHLEERRELGLVAKLEAGSEQAK